MPGPDQDKMAVKLDTRPFLDSISSVPIKKRRIFFSRSPSPPPAAQSSLTVDGSAKKNIDKSSFIESGFKSFADGVANEDECIKHQDFTVCEGIERLQSVTSSAVERENGFSDTSFDEKLSSLKGFEPHSAHFSCIDVPIKEEILDTENILSRAVAAQKCFGNAEHLCKEKFNKVHFSESHVAIQVKTEKQDSMFMKMEKHDSIFTKIVASDAHDYPKKCITPEHGMDPTPITLDRSTWDLNTTMDTWKESPNGLEASNEGKAHGRLFYSDLIARSLQTNFVESSGLSQGPNASSTMIKVPKNLSGDSFLSLLRTYNSGSMLINSESEACLDLRLKPSIVPESCITYGTALGNIDSRNEPQFLCAFSTADLKNFSRGATEPETYHECIRHEEMKAEIANSETRGVKPIKYESPNLGKVHTLATSCIPNSVIKMELTENNVQDSVELNISGDYHNLLQSAEMSLRTVDTHSMHPNAKSDIFIKNVIFPTHMEYPYPQELAMDGVAKSLQGEIFMDSTLCCMTTASVASILQPEKEIFCEPSVDEDSKIISVKQEFNEGSEPTNIFSKCQAENQPENFVNVTFEKRHITAELPRGSFDSCDLVEMASDKGNCASFKSSENAMNDEDDGDLKKSISHAIDGEIHIKDCDFKDGKVKNDVNEICPTRKAKKKSKSGCVELISAKRMRNDCCEQHTGVFSKYQAEDTDESLVTLTFEKRQVAAELLREPIASFDVVEMATDKGNCAAHKFRENMINEKDNVLKESISHASNGKMLNNDHSLEDVRVKHVANGVCHMKRAKKMSKDGSKMNAEVHATKPMADVTVKHSVVECASSIDSAIAADFLESSSVTGDSNQRATNKTTRKIRRESLNKNAIHDWKINADRDPSLRFTNSESIVKDNCLVENSGELAKPPSSLMTVEIAKEPIRGIRTGRIINLKSVSARKIKPVYERPLTSMVERESYVVKFLNRDKSHSHHSRDKSPSQSPCKTESRKRKECQTMPLRIGNESRPNKFIDRSFDRKLIREQMNDFRYSRSIHSAKFSQSNSSRITRKVAHGFQTRTLVSCRSCSPGGQDQTSQRETPDHSYASQEKMAKVEFSGRIPAYRERRRGSPMRSPKSQDMSPRHWSPHNSVGFNGQPEPLRSARRCFSGEIISRRRGHVYRDGLSDAIMGRERDFSIPEQDFSRKFRQVPREHYRSAPFVGGQIREHSVSENEAYIPARCTSGDDIENFPFSSEAPNRLCRYNYTDDHRGFNNGRSSREIEGRFKNRLSNESRKYNRQIDQQQHEDGFRCPQEQRWNDFEFNYNREKRRKY